LEDNERGLLGQFRHQYFLLFLISHFHKAALLMLSDRLVAAIKLLEVRSALSSASFRRETYRLQEAFMRFTQRYWFTEVSDQAQTRDLFRMQRAHLGNDDLYKELRNEIFDMVQYLDSDVLRRQSGTFHRLTAVTIIGLIGTTATGFLGMNLIDETGAPLLVKLGYFCIVAAAVTSLTIGVVVFSRSLTALLDRMSGERP
jgi:Mg2+ and Co2+ transporter CorA